MESDQILGCEFFVDVVVLTGNDGSRIGKTVTHDGFTARFGGLMKSTSAPEIRRFSTSFDWIKLEAAFGYTSYFIWAAAQLLRKSHLAKMGR